MPLHPIKAEVIEDGAMLESLDDAIHRAAQDVIGRDTTAGKRTVTLKIGITPRLEQSKGLKVCIPEIDWSVAVSVPGVCGMTTRAHLRNTGRETEMIVRTGDPYESNLEQTSILEIEPRE